MPEELLMVVLDDPEPTANDALELFEVRRREVLRRRG